MNLSDTPLWLEIALGIFLGRSLLYLVSAGGKKLYLKWVYRARAVKQVRMRGEAKESQDRRV